MTILVTGAAGFAGSHVVQTLAGAGNVIGWMRATPPADEIAPLATSSDPPSDRPVCTDLRPARSSGSVYYLHSSPTVAIRCKRSVVCTSLMKSSRWRSGFCTRTRPDLHKLHGIEIDTPGAVGIQPMRQSAIRI